MATRSTLVFDVWPYPDRAAPEMLTLYLAKHDDGDPAAMQDHILPAWTKARAALAADSNDYAHHPQISICQAIAGVLLADTGAQFRLSDDVARDSAYVYRFGQATTSWMDAELSIIRGNDETTIFEGGFQAFAKWCRLQGW